MEVTRHISWCDSIGLILALIPFVDNFAVSLFGNMRVTIYCYNSLLLVLVINRDPLLVADHNNIVVPSFPPTLSNGFG